MKMKKQCVKVTGLKSKINSKGRKVERIWRKRKSGREKGRIEIGIERQKIN